MSSTSVLYISDSIGLGHAARDLAIARTLPVGLEWIASALPWLARPPPPGGMTGDPRPVAAGLRALDLPWVIAQK